MRPILFQLGSFAIPSFFFMLMVASLVASFYGAWRAEKAGKDPVVVLDLAIITTIACVLGGRLFHVIVEAPSYYLENPWRILHVWEGGFVSIGAILMSAVAWFVYLRWRKRNFLEYVDVTILAVPIVFFFVRVGCLLVGCCYGKPTDFFFHLTFTNPGSTAYYFHPNEPLHATQIYLMLKAVILFVVLELVYRRRRFDGQTAAIFLMLYAIMRSTIELLRGDADRMLYFNDMISTAQLASIAFFVLGLVVWGYGSRRHRLAS
ncbi:MAG: prolipoprotein diacylglyceryl transferase [Deltaproteobacteria bacterium]|nr:prolipoprotein diacylglyceryl transferase [Deltaproteobacteria bacterium]